MRVAEVLARNSHFQGRNFWQGLECRKVIAELLTAPTKITQVHLSKSPNCLLCLQNTSPSIGSRRANNHDTQRNFLFRVISNADTMTATNIKDSFELWYFTGQWTKKPECHCPLRLQFLTAYLKPQQVLKITVCFGKKKIAPMYWETQL